MAPNTVEDRPDLSFTAEREFLSGGDARELRWEVDEAILVCRPRADVTTPRLTPRGDACC
jgi:hypothetical protein